MNSIRRNIRSSIGLKNMNINSEWKLKLHQEVNVLSRLNIPKDKIIIIRIDDNSIDVEEHTKKPKTHSEYWDSGIAM